MGKSKRHQRGSQSPKPDLKTPISGQKPDQTRVENVDGKPRNGKGKSEMQSEIGTWAWFNESGYDSTSCESDTDTGLETVDEVGPTRRRVGPSRSTVPALRAAGRGVSSDRTRLGIPSSTVRGKGIVLSPRTHKNLYNVRLQAKRARNHIRKELFDWSGPLPELPYVEDPANIFNVVYVLLELEKFLLFGTTLCLDVLLYCMSFLPIQFVIAVSTYLRKLLCPCKKVQIYAKHTYALIQGLIMLATIILLSFLDLDLNDNYERIDRALEWTRLHTLFLMFEAMDMLLNAFGQRISGSLVYSVKHQRNRVLMSIIATVALVVHCSVMNMQVSAVHKALDEGDMILGLLISVKLTATDLKAGLQYKLSESDLRDILVNDVVARFRWFAFLLLILYFRFTSSFDATVSHSDSTLSTTTETGTETETESESANNPLDMVSTYAMMMLVVTLLVDVFVQWLKHAFFFLVNVSWLQPHFYSKVRFEFSKCFLSAPKLGFTEGIGSASDTQNTLSQSFHFISLPFTCIILRALWNGIDRMTASSSYYYHFLFVIGFYVFGFLLKILTRLVLRAYAKRVHLRPNRRMTRSHSLGIFSIFKQGLVDSLRPNKQLSPQKDSNHTNVAEPTTCTPAVSSFETKDQKED